MLQNEDKIKNPSFRSYVRDSLASQLTDFENERQTTFHHFRLIKILHYITFFGAMAGFGIGLDAIINESSPHVGIPLLIVGAVLWLIDRTKMRPFFQKAEDFRDHIKDQTLPLILKHFGDYKYQPSQGGLDWESFPKGLMPRECEYTITEDHLFQKDDRQEIDIFDLKCVYSYHTGAGQSRRKQVNLLFNGLYVRMSMPNADPQLGFTLIKDRGPLNHTGDMYHDLQRATLESQNFEKHFDIFTNDQIGVRKVFTPTFMEKVTEFQKQLSLAIRSRKKNNFLDPIEGQHPHIEHNAHNLGLRIVLSSGVLHATLPIPSEIFDTPPLSRSLLDATWIQAVYEDLNLLYSFMALIQQSRALQG
tara:strand:+ start:430 stop:1512 length:1083 start_codon:yes stop_codon:yes gene_type:complete